MEKVIATYVLYVDVGKSGLGFDPFTKKFDTDKKSAISLVKTLTRLFPSDRFGLQESGKSGWVWKN